MYDEDANVYWISKADARHSAISRSNPTAALAILDSGQTPGVGRVDGLYAEGTVDKLDPGDVDRIMPSIERWLAWRDWKRVQPRPARPSDSVWQFHRLIPTVWYALDAKADSLGPADWRVPVDFRDSLQRRYPARQ